MFAASSLTDVFNKLGDDFRKTDPSARFTFNFGSSSTLATQIINGAPADLFASADEDNMAKVVAAGQSDGAPQVFATNRLQIAVAPGNPKKIAGPSDLARAGVILVLAAPTVPAGKYALEALKKAGVEARPVSQEIDVRSVLNKVALGEADAGVVYFTDVSTAYKDKVRIIGIPQRYEATAQNFIAAAPHSSHPDFVRDFISMATGPTGQSIFRKHGYDPMP